MNECAECGKPSKAKYCRWQCRYPNRTRAQHRAIVRKQARRQIERQALARKQARQTAAEKIRANPHLSREKLAKLTGLSIYTIQVIRTYELEEPRRRNPRPPLVIQGEILTAKEGAERSGLSRRTIGNRIGKGWAPERILTAHCNSRAHRANMAAVVAAHPSLTNEELGRLIGRSESAVSRIRSGALQQPRRKSGRKLPTLQLT